MRSAASLMVRLRGVDVVSGGARFAPPFPLGRRPESRSCRVKPGRGVHDDDRAASGSGFSLATWAVDIAFWLVWGGFVAVIVYAIYFAPRG
jgi:hypothetical protein